MSRKTMATVCGFVFVAMIAPASAQQSGTSGSSGASDQAAGPSSGTASAGDARQAAMLNVEQIGIQDARALDGALVLEGTSPTATPIFLIVGPAGDLLAIAAPLPAAEPASGTSAAPQAGESAVSGYLATQRNPATQHMWDPVAVESAMRSLELGARAIAGEVPAQ